MSALIKLFYDKIVFSAMFLVTNFFFDHPFHFSIVQMELAMDLITMNPEISLLAQKI